MTAHVVLLEVLLPPIFKAVLRRQTVCGRLLLINTRPLRLLYVHLLDVLGWIIEPARFGLFSYPLTPCVLLSCWLA